MTHAGLPWTWAAISLVLMSVMAVWFLIQPRQAGVQTYNITSRFHTLSAGFERLTNIRLLLILRVIVATVFLLVIYAGLFGTALPERNLATVVTWSLWWTGVIVVIPFVGPAWCGICPWDAISTWLARRRLFGRAGETSSLQLRLPRALQNVWPATILFIGFSILELGTGLSASPGGTAYLALAMVVLALLGQVLFERKAFCQYGCPVGRTIGTYAQISPVGVAAIDTRICADCTTLECFNGSADVEPCPTRQVVERGKQAIYCTACGACTQSCPKDNAAWQWRSQGGGPAITRPVNVRTDEAGFFLVLLALTYFHGVTMLPLWEKTLSQTALWLNDNTGLLLSFTVLMVLVSVVPVGLYLLFVLWVRLFSGGTIRRAFAHYALMTVPLAFAYHLAHNLGHMFREWHGVTDVMMNPLGMNTLPLSMQALHDRHMNPLLDPDIVFALQALLIVAGFLLALSVWIARLEMVKTTNTNGVVQRLPGILFLFVVSGISLWLLAQPMVMRL